jgi:hypothetical protein
MGCGTSAGPAFLVLPGDCRVQHTITPAQSWAYDGAAQFCSQCGTSMTVVDRPIVWQGKEYHWRDTERQLRSWGAA